MIDYHCHILPGIDDGAKNLTDSLEMARLLAGAGFREVCCTPHCIRGSYDNTPVRVKSAVAALQAELDREGIALRLRSGMEYYLDEFFLRIDELQPLGGSRMVLAEAPGQANPGVVQAGMIKIVSLGFTPLIAHPERTPLFNGADAARKKTPSLDLPPGCQFQANIGSFTGFYGGRVQRCAYDKLRDGVYALLGSDAHDPLRLADILESWQGKMEVNPVLRQLAGQCQTSGPDTGIFDRLAWA